MAPTKGTTAVSNPYSKENREKRQAEQRGKDTFNKMMRNMNRKQPPKPPKKPVDSLRSASARAAAALRNANRERRNASSDKAKKGSWQKTTSIFITGMVDLVKKSVGFSENGKHERYGKWPAFAYPPVIQPSKDPVNFLGLIGDERQLNELTREDFALPDLMIWAPELRWEHLYPSGRPCCPFHPGRTDCVQHNGYADYPRRCYGPRGNVALQGKRYKCSVREKQKEEPYTFYSYDTAVLMQAPDYVKSYWRENGFRLSGGGAFSWTLIDNMRALFANGAGAAGFVKTLRESYKQAHASKAKMWRDHCDLLYQCSAAETRTDRSVFFDFDDPRFETVSPSVNFLLALVIMEIESKVPFYERKLQMVGGRFLSADHSHKFAKVVLIQGNRGFEGLYVVMNEFGKILGWWFVSGTTLREVESSLRGINRRYMLHGFQGPLVFTTDRCCDERETIAGNNNAEQKPVFASFEKANKDANNANNANVTMDTSEDGNFIQVKEIDLPSPPVRPSSKDTAEVTVSEIIRECEVKNWDTIAIDSEWNRGTKTGPEVFTIATPDSRTYLFHKSVFPPSLKILLESETIKKVANRISSDKSKLKEIGINLAGAVELGWLAKERGIVNRRNPNLEELVEKLFDCGIDKDGRIRLSDWSKQDLSKQQIQYAAIDVYAHMFCYLKLLSMPFLDPTKVKAPKMSELKNGESVLLYTKNHQAVVASAVFVVGQSTKTLFGTTGHSTSIATVRVAQDDVRILSAVVRERGSMSLAQLLQEEDVVEEEATGFIEIPWKLKDLRVSTTSIEPQEQISVVTKMVSIPAPSTDDDADDGTASAEPVDPTNSSLGDMEEDPEHDRYFHKGVKQDIEHIFLRFARVLTKGHGVFGAFMSRLSDAFFIPSQEDIEFIKAALRRSGVSDEDINKNRWQYYKRRVRRRVSLPKELEREFKRVVNLFANLEDAKTGKPLFGEKAWALYKSTLRHIRKGCLSDIPGIAYYVQTGEDSMGIPLFTCVRGTSALEGFHQKIRQVIRGFNVSPRYAIALLHEFIYRWNHDVDVRILGLPTKYANYYDGWEIEEEIEQTCSWEELEKVPHRFWESTKDYAPTGETFALIRNDSVVAPGQSATVNDDIAVDADLDAEIAKVVDAMKDGTLDDTQADSAANIMLSSQILTESAAWVGKQLGVERGQGPVRRASEKTFFQSNYHTFQNSGDDAEADNFAAFAFGRFALFWNEWIAEEESGSRPKSDMTLKNAYHLQAYWKQLKKDGNCVATLLPVRDENKALRREYRGQSRQTNAAIPDSAPAKVAALQRKAVEASSVEEEGPIFADADSDAEDSTPAALTPTPTSTPAAGAAEPVPAPNRVLIQAFAGRLPRGVDAREYMSTGARHENNGADGASVKRRKQKDEGKTKVSKAPYRCRQCGHSYGRGQSHAQHHVGRGDPGQASRAKKKGTAQLQYLKPNEVCSVPEESREPGFPLNQGERMPRRKRARKKEMIM
jgi:hypothetical protein